MRKFQKEQLLDIFTSLHTLHQESKARLEQREFQTVQTALSDCQEAAIQMGEVIELLVGKEQGLFSFPIRQVCGIRWKAWIW
ncbi:MAG: hypothetical protein J6K43_03240 [Lachnospiraceae bacterium]|nr:hypothetical protein [Lachnospiraceae bacterium]